MAFLASLPNLWATVCYKADGCKRHDDKERHGNEIRSRFSFFAGARQLCKIDKRETGDPDRERDLCGDEAQSHVRSAHIHQPGFGVDLVKCVTGERVVRGRRLHAAEGLHGLGGGDPTRSVCDETCGAGRVGVHEAGGTAAPNGDAAASGGDADYGYAVVQIDRDVRLSPHSGRNSGPFLRSPRPSNMCRAGPTRRLCGSVDLAYT